MLSEEEQAALERWRAQEYDSIEKEQLDLYALADRVASLYPPGWNDPVTPERLVGLGGELDRFSEFPDSCYVFFGPIGSKWYVEFKGQAIVGWKPHSGDIPRMFFPRNMKEARELLVKCGAIKEEM